ncbi:MAG: hypothetical protein IJG56_01370 [Clostridia bacterium]|nr:hypothetical protein [Clostridia bacterium]
MIGGMTVSPFKTVRHKRGCAAQQFGLRFLQSEKPSHCESIVPQGIGKFNARAGGCVFFAAPLQKGPQRGEKVAFSFYNLRRKISYSLFFYIIFQIVLAADSLICYVFIQYSVLLIFPSCFREAPASATRLPKEGLPAGLRGFFAPLFVCGTFLKLTLSSFPV